MPVKQSEAAMSPEQRRREVAALLGLAVRRLARRPGTVVERSPEHGCAPEHGPARPHGFPSRSPLDGAEDAGRDRPLPGGRGGPGDDGGDR